MWSGPLTLLALLGLAVPLGSQPAADDAVRDLVGRSADFSTRLYRALASRSDDNVLLSGASVWRGLAALLAATGGATREELRTALGLAGLDPQNISGGSGKGFLVDKTNPPTPQMLTLFPLRMDS